MVVLQHEHSLILVDLNPKYPDDEEVYDDEEDLIIKQGFQCPCNLCCQEIFFLHRYYYKCNQCDYLVHKLCGELPTKWEHASHKAHTLTLLDKSHKQCHICKTIPHRNQLCYQCSRCMFNICVDCAMDAVQHHTIYHPSHQHPIIPINRHFSGKCDACGLQEAGVFYQCVTCFRSFIHKDCVFRPKKLLIQDSTCRRFFHAHPLTLTYSFPKVDQEAKFDPPCRVCGDSFSENENLWIYKCEKCRYYVHLDCGNSDMTTRNYNDDPDIFHFPLPDQTYKILEDFIFKMSKETTKTHPSHQHPLILVDASSRCNDITTPTSSRTNEVIDLCDGCTRPIMDMMPFYKCTYKCNFVLHEWCTRLPAELKGYTKHQQHTLLLLPKAPNNDLGLFNCDACIKTCNGFVYYCAICRYSIDVSCAFIPEDTTHISHPHILSRYGNRPSHKDYCRMCLHSLTYGETSLTCRMCTSFHLHLRCALLYPTTITHRYDKHPMTLSYGPVENYDGDYFCEVCEEELNPNASFYHCHQCGQSLHLTCAPLTPQLKAYINGLCREDVSRYMNIKFGGTKNIKSHPHPLTFLYGTESDGQCDKCDYRLEDYRILKCPQCKFSIHADHMNYML